jgi:hypothetical protein
MQKRTLKESGKQRECLKQGVAKKVDPKEQKGLFLLGFEPESGVYNSKYGFAPYFYFYTKIRRIYGIMPYVRRMYAV